MSEVSDVELAERWRAGDRRAGDELLVRYYDQLRGYFVNAVGQQESLDLLHETFERLLKSLPNFAGRSSFRTFLFVIARNTRVDFYRRRYKLPPSFDSSESSVEDISGITPTTAVALLEGGRRLNVCVRALSIDDREMIELFYWHGWQATEIAELFELNDFTVRARLDRARETLRKCLEHTTEEVSRDAASDELVAQLRQLGRELGLPGNRVPN
jgi:RNA polymerase sigma-70 factor (ECF subfamily)